MAQSVFTWILILLPLVIVVFTFAARAIMRHWYVARSLDVPSSFVGLLGSRRVLTLQVLTSAYGLYEILRLGFTARPSIIAPAALFVVWIYTAARQFRFMYAYSNTRLAHINPVARKCFVSVWAAGVIIPLIIITALAGKLVSLF